MLALLALLAMLALLAVLAVLSIAGGAGQQAADSVEAHGQHDAATAATSSSLRAPLSCTSGLPAPRQTPGPLGRRRAAGDGLGSVSVLRRPTHSLCTQPPRHRSAPHRRVLCHSARPATGLLHVTAIIASSHGALVCSPRGTSGPSNWCTQQTDNCHRPGQSQQYVNHPGDTKPCAALTRTTPADPESNLQPRRSESLQKDQQDPRPRAKERSGSYVYFIPRNAWQLTA